MSAIYYPFGNRHVQPTKIPLLAVNKYVVMVKQDRRPHLSSVLGDHRPAIHGEAWRPASRLSGQAKARAYLFLYSTRSQPLVEANDSGYVIICGETNVHDHYSNLSGPDLTSVTQATSRLKDFRRIHISSL